MTISLTDPFTTTQTYSATRKPVLTSFPPARLTTIPTVTTGTPTIQKLYDYRDWLKTVTDPLLHNFNYIYDGGGRLYQTSDQLSHTTTLGYDNDGHKTSVTSPLVAATQTTQFGYNPRGDQTTMTDAANSVVNYTYDNNGQPLTTKNRDGNTFTSTYYNDGRPWTFRTPKLNTTTYTYFPSGLLNSLAKPSAKQSSYTYDNRGRLWTLTDLVGSSTYGYDADNNLLTHSENSKSITRVYDKLNRTTSYTDENGNIIGYVYDANGNLTQLSYPGNNIVKYKYDANNRLYQVTDWNNAVTTFTRDLAGRVLTTTRPNQTVRSVTYDNVGGTLQIEELSPTGYPISLFMLNYDEAGRATNEVIAPLPIAYTESARLSTFDVDNRIATFNGQTVAHDVDGNMTSGPLNSSTPVTHVYDARNRLTSVAASGSAPALIYGYDSEGNRTSVIQAGQTAVYVVSPVTGQVLMRIKSGVTTYYIYGEGLLYQVDSSGNTATYHYDSRGSTVAITDGSGNVTDRAEYSPYGATILRSGTTDTPFLYNGRYGVVTDANGLLFMRARYYNPYLCRFINADPSGFGGGLNFYAYANGDPISMVDPFGLGAFDQDPMNSSWFSNGFDQTLYDIGNSFSNNGAYLAYLNNLAAYSITIGLHNGSVLLDDGLNWLGIPDLAALTPLAGEINALKSITEATDAAETGGDVLRVRHYTSYEGLQGIQDSGEIWASRGDPIGVHVEVGPSFGPAATGAADTGAAAQGARGVYVEFDAPGAMVPTPWVGPRTTAVIPTTSPLPISSLNPTFVKPPWWKIW